LGGLLIGQRTFLVAVILDLAGAGGKTPLAV
jgi:hypothetical protein